MIKKIFLMVFFSVSLMSAFAQSGLVKGKLTEEMNGQQIGLPFANVFLEGTTTGGTTDFDGNFQFAALAGNYNLMCTFLGYQTYKQNIDITADGEISISIEMKPEGLAIEAVLITAKVNRESDVALIIEQKNASIAIENIGARQLIAQGVSDAAAGVAKVTGVTKQSGSNTINVRGLGDRYNTTTLNGLPLPSNHAEYKNINLELFGTEIIGYIGVEKAFASTLYSDVAGANVNIVSKRYHGDSFVKLGLKVGSNSNLFGVDNFYLQDGPGFMGFDKFPAPKGEYAPTNYDVFQNKWNPINKSINPNLGFAIQAGHTLKFNDGSKLSLFASASFDNEHGYTDRIENKVNGSGFYRSELAGEEFWYDTQATGMLNLNYSKGDSEYYFNSLVLNSSNQDMTQLQGFIIDIVGVKEDETAFVRRSNYERNLILVNQLLGKHKLNATTNINWGLAYNTVDNTLPDRRHNTFVQTNETGIFVPSTNDHANNHRYWHELEENEFAANLALNKAFGKSLSDKIEHRSNLTIGYSGRFKQRDFNSIQYNHRINRNNYNDPIDIWNVDNYFNVTTMDAGNFDLRTFYGTLNLPVTYSGVQQINSGFAQFEYNFSEKFLAVLGVRAENVYQKIDYKTTIKTGTNNFKKFGLFPSLSLLYKATPKTNVRFAGSQTYTLPQFKETAPFQFEGITYSTVGNPYLYPSTNYNADLKWEYFPESGELVSVTGFGKYIKNPINHFVMSSASNDFTYANTGDWAYVYGLELDFKKKVFNKSTASSNQNLSVGANLSLMYTLQELDNEKVSSESEGKYISSFNTDREVLQGAAPVLANASLNYINKWDEGKRSVSGSIVYAYTSERVFLLGYAGAIGNQIDKAYSDLDLVLKTKINKLEFTLMAKNLLNPNMVRYQQNDNKDYTILSYKEGVDFKLGISYKF